MSSADAQSWVDALETAIKELHEFSAHNDVLTSQDLGAIYDINSRLNARLTEKRALLAEATAAEAKADAEWMAA